MRVILVLLCGCGRIAFDLRDDGATPDAITRPLTCEPFTAIEQLASLNTTSSEFGPAVTANGHELYFFANRGVVGGDDIYRATRSDTALPFGGAAPVAELCSSDNDGGIAISPDGLTIVFSSDRPGGAGLADFWIATRASMGAMFDPPTNLSAVNSPQNEYGARLTPDLLTLYLTSDRPGPHLGFNIWRAKRLTTTGPFEAAVPLPVLNANSYDGGGVMRADGFELLFETDRNGGSTDIWSATRATLDDDFGDPVRVVELASPTTEFATSLSADGETLYFSSGRAGGAGNDDLWLARRTCQ